MEIRRINDDIAVAPQIAAEHVPAIAKAGFRSIVCNRPDSEDGAVPHDRVEQAAKAAGLEFRFIPVVSGAITEDNVREMAAALKALPTPVLAYCRTGGRCMNLYGLVQQMNG
ncbi:TIGR01244 family sulfur transferase [Aquibium microcysteis]|uniref:TIGR01244 family sulfur transferase n=1 Tax=Aquibium microcysteis TaxID=675281 RepID=UPI00165CF784|nr:TIGR01244 family sulfur transferase [Aquibium microcysteis]